MCIAIVLPPSLRQHPQPPAITCCRLPSPAIARFHPLSDIEVGGSRKGARRGHL